MVVDALASLGHLVLQGHQHDAGLVVGGHQLADLAGALHVEAHLGQAFQRTVVVVGHHRAPVEAFLGHAGPAHRGRPQGLHVGTVDAGVQEQLVGDLLHRVQVVRVEDVALLRLDGDAQAVAHTRQLPPVLQEVDDVGVLRRDHLLKGGVEAEPQGLIAQDQAHQRAEHDNDETVVEEDALGQRARAGVEIRQVADYQAIGQIVGVTHFLGSAMGVAARAVASMRLSPRAPETISAPSAAWARLLRPVGSAPTRGAKALPAASPRSSRPLSSASSTAPSASLQGGAEGHRLGQLDACSSWRPASALRHTLPRRP
jgi:hypothetical protein